MSLAPGTRLGPYEVLSPLGAGGMGEVYRARDTRLGRDVAVKVLPDHLAGDPKALRRFQDEAKAVAALSHPNILALYDVGETNGVRYAVTELLEGETLRALVDQGPVSTKRALSIAHHVADALAAAHEKGIVHRDVKPENVFLAKDGHVKLLDFGLARHQAVPSGALDTRSPTVPVLTESGSILGTVAYMPPEQARGQAVDHRTDQFSLGVTLYEMLSGKRPFRGEDAASLVSAILRDEPEPLATAAPSAPVGVRLVVERCLAKDPRERYASTRDLGRDLAAWHEQVSGAAAFGGPASGPAAFLPTAARSPASRRRLVAAVAVATLALAGSVGLWVWRKAGSTGAPETGAATAAGASVSGSRLDPKRIAVAPFENRTGDASLSTLGQLAAEQVIDALAKVTTVKVIPSSTVLPVTADSAGAGSGRDPVHALAEATGAGTVISGAYYLVGPNLQIQAKVTDVTAGKLLWPIEPASAPKEKAGDAVEAIRRQVLEVVAARHLDPEGDLLVRENRPPRFEALETYLKEPPDPVAGEALARKALELDPGFLSPRFWLLFTLMQQNRYPEAEIEFGQFEAMGDRMTPLMRRSLDFARADLYGRKEEQYSIALDLESRVPGNYVAAVVALAFQTNRPRTAVEWHRKPSPAWDLLMRPSWPMGFLCFLNLAGALHQLGQHEEELKEARRGRGVYPDLLNSWALEARALVALGRLDEMEKLVGEAVALPPRWGYESCCMVRGTPGVVMLAAAEELRAHGHPERAVKMAERAAGWYRNRTGDEAKRETNRECLGESLYRAGRWDEAKPVFAALAKEKPSDVTYKGWLGVIAARKGDRAEAERISAELGGVDTKFLLGLDALWRAQIAALLGDKEGAVALLKESVARGTGLPKARRELYGYGYLYPHLMDLESLRGYGPFEELVKPKG